jgi:CMP-N-acetylneuraminic acid synthetase
MFVVYQFDFMQKKKLTYKPFVLPLYQSVDIDDMEDFNLAKNLYKK